MTRAVGDHVGVAESRVSQLDSPIRKTVARALLAA